MGWLGERWEDRGEEGKVGEGRVEKRRDGRVGKDSEGRRVKRGLGLA